MQIVDRCLLKVKDQRWPDVSELLRKLEPFLPGRRTTELHIDDTPSAGLSSFPEADAGKRVAHLVNGRLMDFIEFDDDFAIVKMRPPHEVQGMTLADSDIRKRFGVTVVGVKSPGKDFTYALPETVVAAHDLLIVSGRTGQIEKFSQRA